MLPSPLLPGSLEACVVVAGKVWRDHGKEGKATYFTLFCGRPVIFKGKCIPSGVAAKDTEILVYGVDHMRIAVVV